MGNNHIKTFIITLLIISNLSALDKTVKNTHVNSEIKEWNQEDKRINNPELQMLLEQLKREFSTERDILEKEFRMKVKSLKEEYARKRELLKNQYKKDKPIKLKLGQKETVQNKKPLPVKEKSKTVQNKKVLPEKEKTEKK